MHIGNEKMMKRYDGGRNNILNMRTACVFIPLVKSIVKSITLKVHIAMECPYMVQLYVLKQGDEMFSFGVQNSFHTHTIFILTLFTTDDSQLNEINFERYKKAPKGKPQCTDMKKGAF